MPATDVTSPAQLPTTGAALILCATSWCSSCRAFAPHLERAATRRGIALYRLELTNNPASENALVIVYVPTTLYMKDGAEVDRLIGFQSPAVLEKWLDKHFA